MNFKIIFCPSHLGNIFYVKANDKEEARKMADEILNNRPYINRNSRIIIKEYKEPYYCLKDYYD